MFDDGRPLGGREKAPAAFCRKAAACEDGDVLDIWGDGNHTRSFCYIDDCVECILRIMHSDYDKPLNLGSDEMIDMNSFLEMAVGFSGKKVTYKHIPGPEGVRGRNSDNNLIKRVLGWSPQISLKDGMKRTYDWIKAQIDEERKNGINENYLVSKIVKQDTGVLDNIGGLLN